MTEVKLFRLFHRGKWRIGMRYSYNPQLNSLVRQVTGARYSGTEKCWYIDNDPARIDELSRLLEGKAVINSTEIDQATGNRDKMSSAEKPMEQDSMDSGKKADNEEVYYAKKVEISIIHDIRKIRIKFRGYYRKEWIDEMKQYGYVEYIKDSNEWLLPWTKQASDSLSDYFASVGLQVIQRKAPLPEVLRKSRKETAAEIRSRNLSPEAQKAIDLLESHLVQKRSSHSTIKVYLSMLTLFLKYYAGKDPARITDEEIVDFIEEVIIANKYSASTQNQAISAIRTYYRIVGHRRRAENLLRPKKAMTLPSVFSQEEVKLILGNSHNIKHKLILMLIYSCGLRRGELINIRLKDLDRSRGLLHIRQGKGKVDRVIPISDKVWKRIDEYLAAFNPSEYLIEGQTGGKYSAASVHNIFKAGINKAGIKKDLGVHALRHSYATHLHEGGLDIRYIQELLGHRSSRTTEIYTKISRRNIANLKSPIDDIDIE